MRQIVKTESERDRQIWQTGQGRKEARLRDRWKTGEHLDRKKERTATTLEAGQPDTLEKRFSVTKKQWTGCQLDGREKVENL